MRDASHRFDGGQINIKIDNERLLMASEPDICEMDCPPNDLKEHMLR
jgi:hypothetical protein